MASLPIEVPLNSNRIPANINAKRRGTSRLGRLGEPSQPGWHSGSVRSAGVRSLARSVFLGQGLVKTSLARSLSCSLARSVFLGQGLVKTSLAHSPLVGRLHFLLGQALAKKCRLPPRSRLALSATMPAGLAWLAQPAQSLPVSVATLSSTIMPTLMTVN